MNRRAFIKGLGAAAFGPWVVTHAGVLMPIKPSTVIVPEDGKFQWVRMRADINGGEITYAVSEDGVVWRPIQKADKIQPSFIVDDGKFVFSVHSLRPVAVVQQPLISGPMPSAARLRLQTQVYIRDLATGEMK